MDVNIAVINLSLFRLNKIKAFVKLFWKAQSGAAEVKMIQIRKSPATRNDISALILALLQFPLQRDDLALHLGIQRPH